MARVYDGFDQRLERPVAVKILRPQTLALPNMCKRFQQEARIAARLVHPNIVAVLDYGEDDSSSYLIMERLPGTTLRDEIMRGPLPRQRVMSVMVETLAALAAAHKLGVVHRDIKPSNILLQDDGHAKITDFGIAKSFDVGGAPDRVADDLTMTGVVLGTPGYLSPERRSGQPATVQSDLFAVGAVMVEVLTGRRLVPGPEATEQLPVPFRDVARRALAVDPRDRFTSATDMLRALRTQRADAAVAPTAGPNHADVIGGGHPPGRCPQGRWRDRGLVIASSRASQKRAHAARGDSGPSWPPPWWRLSSSLCTCSWAPAPNPVDGPAWPPRTTMRPRTTPLRHDLRSPTPKARRSPLSRHRSRTPGSPETP